MKKLYTHPKFDTVLRISVSVSILQNWKHIFVTMHRESVPVGCRLHLCGRAV